jgi:hypothetical protein
MTVMKLSSVQKIIIVNNSKYIKSSLSVLDPYSQVYYSASKQVFIEENKNCKVKIFSHYHDIRKKVGDIARRFQNSSDTSLSALGHI